MQQKVPQGIEMQDRIFGPLTMVQFGFLLFGGLVAYFLFLKLPDGPNVWAAIIVFGISLGLSFESARRMLVAAIAFLFKPRLRVWHKGVSPKNVVEATKGQIKKQNLPKTTKVKNPAEIASLAQVLDTHGKTNV